MKHYRKLLLLLISSLFLLFCMACASDSEPSNSTETTETAPTESDDIPIPPTDIPTEPTVPTETIEDPVVMDDSGDTILSEEIFFQEDALDLDGEGLPNDSIIIKRVNGEDGVYDLLTVTLSSGLSDSMKFPCQNPGLSYVDFSIGPLQYEDKNSIILEFQCFGSNYNAVDYHILHLDIQQGDDTYALFLREDLTVLDGQSDRFYSLYANTLYELPDRPLLCNILVDMLVYLEAQGKYALQVIEYGWNEQGNVIAVPYYIYWDGEAWQHVKGEEWEM